MSDITALLDDPDAIVGASGAGKSYTGRKKVEELLERGRHTIIFDPTGVWYGLQSNATGTGPGFDVPVFGGPKANVPIRPEQGAALAEILLGERASAVIDLSQFEEQDLRRFALDFLTPLRHRERVNLHLVFDEAEEFAPQTPPDDVGFQLVRQMTWVAKRGRVFGLVPTFITQRPADFAKAVLSQVQTLYFHQLIAPADQKPVIDYLKANADKATLDQVRGSLPELARGERWVYSPRRKLLELGVTPPIATFDSMVTPAPGQAKAEPRMLAQLDVSKIRAALAAAAPTEAIPTDAKDALAAGTAVGTALADRDRRIADLQAENAVLKRQLDYANSRVVQWIKRVRAVREAADALERQESDGVGSDVEAGSDHQRLAELPAIVPPPIAAPKRPRPPRDGPHPLAEKLGERMAGIAPAKLTWRQLASLEGYKPDGGYFRAARRDALDRGLLIENGGYVTAPAPTRKRPLTREQAFALWHDVLPEPAPRIMDVLRDEGLMFIGRLASALGYSADGGYFRKGISLLRQNGVIEEVGRNDVQLAEQLPGQSK